MIDSLGDLFGINCEQKAFGGPSTLRVPNSRHVKWKASATSRRQKGNESKPPDKSWSQLVGNLRILDTIPPLLPRPALPHSYGSQQGSGYVERHLMLLTDDGGGGGSPALVRGKRGVEPDAPGGRDNLRRDRHGQQTSVDREIGGVGDGVGTQLCV